MWLRQGAVSEKSAEPVRSKACPVPGRRRVCLVGCHPSLFEGDQSTLSTICSLVADIFLFPTQLSASRQALSIEVYVMKC